MPRAGAVGRRRRDAALKVTLPTLPFDVPPKPKELTSAVPARVVRVNVEDVPPDTSDEAAIDVVDAEGVRWD